MTARALPLVPAAAPLLVTTQRWPLAIENRLAGVHMAAGVSLDTSASFSPLPKPRL